jgi:16S rRNA processing protein RimM
MGKVVGAHGLEGLIRVFSYAESDASFQDVDTVFLRSISGEFCEFTVARVRAHKHVVLMKLEGVSNRREAEEHRGKEVFVRKEAISREDDEYFWHELLGIGVYLDTGEYLGEISQIIPTGANDVYVVKKGNREVLLPATHEVVKEISIENEKMIVSATEGLLDLDEI